MFKVVLSKIFRRKLQKSYFFKGNFKFWDDAFAHCAGYESQLVFEKTTKAALAVKKGEYAFERDSHLFADYVYNWPLLACLFKIYQSNKTLNLIDFGGSLGSVYFQHRPFFESIDKISWNIVELPSIVEFGNENIANEQLHFYKTLEEVKVPINVFLSSSALQYISNPSELLNKIIDKGYEYILFDRISFHDGNQILKIQYTTDQIYEATYPVHFFNEQEIKTFFTNKGYRLFVDFKSYCELDMKTEEGEDVYWKGMMFIKS